MAFLRSQWQVVLAGSTLLDFGNLLESEPEITPNRHVQEVTLLRGAAGNRFPRGNVSHSLAIAKVVEFATANAALQAMVVALSSAPAGKGSCVFSFFGGGGGTLANACLTTGSPRVRVEGSLLKINYHIIGSLI